MPQTQDDTKPYAEVDWTKPRLYLLMVHVPENDEGDEEVITLISNHEVIGHHIELDEGKSITITLKLPGFVESDVQTPTDPCS